jgi:cytohesin
MDVAERLLKLGVDVDSCDNGGQTPLQIALENYGRSFPRVDEQEEGLVQLLLRHGANPNTRDDDGQTLLHVSSRCGYRKPVEWLLKLGLDVNSHNNRGQTPLQIALEGFQDPAIPGPVDRQEVSLVQFLLKHEADPNARDDDGQTLLHVSSRLGHLNAVEGLLELGVDVNSRDNRGQTPFQIALGECQLYLGRKEVRLVQLLLKHGADPNTRADDGQTLLHLSSRDRCLEVAKGLLELGVDVNSCDNRGQTPLQIAFETFKSYPIMGATDLVQLLLKYGADPKIQSDDGQTLLHVFSEYEHLEAAERLLKLGVDVNSRNGRGQTPLHIALGKYEYGHYHGREEVDLVLLLLEHGADPNARDDDGQTPLHLSSEYGRQESAERLLELRADVNSRNNRGQTPLQMAVKRYNGRVEDLGVGLVQLLLKHNADPNTRDEYGRTPLQIALKYGEEEVVQLLLQHGAMRS